MPIPEETISAILTFLGGVLGVVCLLLWIVGMFDWLHQWWERRKHDKNS